MFCKMVVMGRSLVMVVVVVYLFGRGYAQESHFMPDYFNHPCVRPCEDGSESMDCEYHFVAESYHTLARACYNCTNGNISDCARDHCVTANGFSRNIKTINRGIPGPTIQVCEGDTIIVNVDNFFVMAEGLSIHWHGLLQRYTPHMDGVGMITQCPMQSFSSFQYRFVALDSGTHFWHAHTGLQRGEGVFGSFVVRQSPSLEPHTGAYDFDLPEHVVIVNEWQNDPLAELFTAFHHAGKATTIDAIMINGRAQDPSLTLELPLAEFKVEPGQRYRFRVINAGSLFCPIQISVDDHQLTLIASDGRAFEPFVVDSFDTYSAERYDFVLTTDQPVGDYLLRARGSVGCGDLEELAVIHYLEGGKRGEGGRVENYTHPHPNHHHTLPPRSAERPPSNGVRFNHVPLGNTGPLGDARDQILHMEALAPDDRSLTGKVDHHFILDFALDLVDNLHYFDPDLYPPGSGPYRSTRSAQINRISNRFGPVPLLSQMNEVPPEEFCNASSVGEQCQTEWCECVHKLTVLEGQVVEMVLISPSSGINFTHPSHQHGYSFRVVAMDKGPEGIMTPELFREMDARGEIKRKLTRAPFKDTVPIPNGGYVIIRFVADNPGVWFAHCHLQFHVEEGMSFVLEVLQKDGSLPPAPEHFPVCGPFLAPAPSHRHPGETGPRETRPWVGSTPRNAPTSDSHLQYQPPNPDPHSHSPDLPQWVPPLVGGLVATILLLLAVVGKLWRERRRGEPSRGRHLYHVIHSPSGEATHEDEDSEGAESDNDIVWQREEKKKLML